MAFVALACWWSPAPVAMKMGVFSKYSKLIYLPVLAVGFIKKNTRFWCINAFVFAMVLTVYAAILKGFCLIDLGRPFDLGDLFFNHIATSFMMSLACYWALLYACQYKGNVRILYGSIFILMSYHVVFLNTGRAGYVVYFLLICVFLLQKCSLKNAALGMVLLVGGFLVVYCISPVMQERVHIFRDEVHSLQQNPTTSLSLRMQFHDYAQFLFSQHPWLGVGTGAFQYSFLQRHICILGWGPNLNEPHSQYWFTLAEQGLVGFVLLFIFLGSLFIAAFRLKENRAFLVGFLVVFCFQALVDSILCYSPIGFLLVVTSALCFGEFIEQQALKKNKVPAAKVVGSVTLNKHLVRSKC